MKDTMSLRQRLNGEGRLYGDTVGEDVFHLMCYGTGIARWTGGSNLAELKHPAHHDPIHSRIYIRSAEPR